MILLGRRITAFLQRCGKGVISDSIAGNRTEELFKDFPYGQKIVKVLKEKFADKLKRRVNTAIVLYDFDWGGHFSNHFLSQMREKKTDEYHIFRIENVYPYK